MTTNTYYVLDVYADKMYGPLDNSNLAEVEAEIIDDRYGTIATQIIKQLDRGSSIVHRQHLTSN